MQTFIMLGELCQCIFVIYTNFEICHAISVNGMMRNREKKIKVNERIHLAMRLGPMQLN